MISVAGHAQALVDDDDLAARHQAVVHIDVDRLADLAVQLEDRGRPSSSSWATDMRARPSTAEMLTGTSKTGQVRGDLVAELDRHFGGQHRAAEFVEGEIVFGRDDQLSLSRQ